MLMSVCNLCCVDLVYSVVLLAMSVFFFFQAEDGIRYLVRSRGLGDVYKRQGLKLIDQEFKIYTLLFILGGMNRDIAISVDAEVALSLIHI